jgi:hypothetical protein
MDRRQETPRRPLAALAVALCLAAPTAPASAQQPTAAVVVDGVRDAASVREPAFGALRARGYAAIPADTVDAAVAIALSGQPITEQNAPQLRAAVSATVLYLVSVRRADGGDRFFSVQRIDAAGARSAFGRASRAELPGRVVQQILTLEGGAPTAPAGGAAAATPATSGGAVTPTPAAATAPTAGSPATTAAGAPAAAPAAPSTAAPAAAAGSGAATPQADGSDPGPSKAAQDAANMALAGGILFAGTAIAGGIMSIFFCEFPASCEADGALGWIPFAGPWLVLGTGNLAEDAIVGLALIGVLQVAGVALVIIGSALGDSAASADPEEATLEVVPVAAPGGGGLGLVGSF